MDRTLQVQHGGDRETVTKAKQIDIKRATFRVVHESPGHTIFGVWVNGGKSGDLTVGNNEVVAFREMMSRAGFEERKL